eukprot:CAMPEP_0171875990 /NCGR_PEP_ID=MMETSP0992-20121227/35865_1 /TAXON_ID=483369 /ORGANISM="non described non described, Strain CCMP2098" /LENGTH=42 /DNA_ID= /DNA_START= /DNA_END= /DNA_ORIENTATION=
MTRGTTQVTTAQPRGAAAAFSQNPPPSQRQVQPLRPLKVATP